MRHRINILRSLIFGRAHKDAGRARCALKASLLCETLEGRVTPAHFHGVHHALAAVYGHHHGDHSESKSSTTATSTTAATAKTSTSTSQNSSESSSSSSSTLSHCSQDAQERYPDNRAGLEHDDRRADRHPGRHANPCHRRAVSQLLVGASVVRGQPGDSQRQRYGPGDGFDLVEPVRGSLYQLADSRRKRPT